jgi:hypothetical protein
MSNLAQTPTGSDLVGGDSWLAVDVRTGTNVSGYMLNSIQLAMTDATGSPSAFTVMLYASIINPPIGYVPGSSLDTLNSSLSPVTAGTYTYTAPSDLTLLPSTHYFIVLTAGTAIASGAYDWSTTSIGSNSSYNLIGGWLGGGHFYSSDGLNWNLRNAYPQFAINATAIPEPSSSFLLSLGSGSLIYARRIRRIS